MSGLEAAGLVLGALPIICGAAKQLKPVLESTKWWWKFETSFENFIADIARQEIAYRQVLKRLVAPLDISEEEYQNLINDPGASLWREAHVRQGLQERLQGEEYRWFMINMEELKAAVLKLQSLLPLDQVYRLDSTDLESELYRLHMSFNNEKDDLLDQITTINNNLHEFLDRASDTPKQRAAKSSVRFRDLQGQARQVYECLAKRWQCSCPAAHSVGISTHTMFGSSAKTTTLGTGYYSLLLGTESTRKQIRVQINDLPTNRSSAATRQKSDDAARKINLEAAAELSRQMDLKKQQNSMSDLAIKKGISNLAISSLQVVKSQHVEPPERRSIFKRMTGRLKKRSVSAINIENASVVATSTDSFAPFTRSTSAISTTRSMNLSITHSESKLSRLSALTPDLSTPSQVRFVDDGPPKVEEAEPQVPMSLCQLGRTPHIDDCRSCVWLSTHQTNVTFAHEESDQAILVKSEVHGVDELLKGISQRLDRLSVGRQVALTILSLANSAWVPQSLSLQDIFLLCTSKEGPRGRKLSRPVGPYFLSHTSQNIIQKDVPSSNTWHAKSSLLLLGILLLELFHGEKLEQQDSWRESLDDGEPNESTVLCGALLWALQARESLVRFLGKDVGGSLSDAILKCVRFDFGYDDDYGDAKLLDVVYEEVVVPLEKCCPPQVA